MSNEGVAALRQGQKFTHLVYLREGGSGRDGEREREIERGRERERER